MADVKQTKFIEDTLRHATLIVTSQEELHSAVDIYTDRGYAAALTDEDLSEYGLTKAQFIDVAEFVTNFDKMLDSQQVTVKDYRKILNTLRTDK